MAFIGVEERTVRIEMVDPFPESVSLSSTPSIRSKLISSTGRVMGKQVPWPSNQLLDHELHCSTKGHFLSELPVGMFGLAGVFAVLLAGLWYELHVLGEVVMQGVVLFVGQLPGEIWNQEDRVQRPACDVVQGFRVGKSAVPAFMGDHPDTNSKETLKEGVERPEGEAEVPGRHFGLRHVGIEDVEGEDDKREILDNIAEPCQSRLLEAAGWDSIFDLLEAVFGDFELLAVGVYNLAIGGFPAFVAYNPSFLVADRGGQNNRSCSFCWRKKLGLSRRHDNDSSRNNCTSRRRNGNGSETAPRRSTITANTRPRALIPNMSETGWLILSSTTLKMESSI